MKIKCFTSSLMLFISLQMYAHTSREVILLDKDWKFHRGEIIDGQARQLNDSEWEEVNVPHDWAINQHFNMNIDKQFVRVIEDGDTISQLRTGRTGALPMFGVGWYRKSLYLPASDNHKRVSIEFDGAMSNAQIFLNGQFVGKWHYGYTSFMFDLTHHFLFGKENILAVRLENEEESSRWYTGAGLYRNIRLVIKEPINVSYLGTHITTPIITNKKAVANIKTSIENTLSETKNIRLVTEIFAPSGEKITSATKQQNIGEDETIFEQKITVKNPQLWNIDNPNLYKAVSNLYVGKTKIDSYETSFGFRSIRFDKEKGFFLNDENIKIKGACMHHDLGPLGSAVNVRATERQLEILKEMGCNAIRTAHNPPSPELLNLCDKMGFLVQVEAFDEWIMGKGKNGYHKYFDDWCERDIAAMIRRDRNHPSVIMWSIGNEIREQSCPNGYLVARRLVDACRAEDNTRPVTAGFNNHRQAIANGLAHEIDLVGFNYKPHDYRLFKEKYPELIIYGSETASTVSSRGEYKFPVKEESAPWYNDYHVSSYDLEYPRWASTPDTEFEMQDENNFVFGEFVWTGFDYLGEPTPYNEGTPARSSYFGIVDLAGLKKDRFYLYQSRWSDTSVLHLLPHWNWHDRLGQEVPIYCYTNYPKAELFVNGKSMGVKQKDNSSKYTRYRLMWDDIIYQPGEIKVVAYNEKDEAIAEKIIKTAGEPHSVKLTSDRSTIQADGKDLSFVTIEIVDKDGNLCPRGNNLLFFEVSGAGVLKSLCNGNPIDHTPFCSNYMHAFNGKMIAIIESTNVSGEICLKVSGGKLIPQEINIKTKTN